MCLCLCVFLSISQNLLSALREKTTHMFPMNIPNVPIYEHLGLRERERKAGQSRPKSYFIAIVRAINISNIVLFAGDVLTVRTVRV